MVMQDTYKLGSSSLSPGNIRESTNCIGRRRLDLKLGLALPSQTSSCDSDFVMTGFDYSPSDSKYFITGTQTLRTSCSDFSTTSTTFFYQFSSLGTGDVFRQASLASSNFINPLYKSWTILVLNQIQLPSPSIGIVFISRRDLAVAEKYFDFTRSGISITQILGTSISQPDPASSQNLLLLTTLDGTNQNNYIALFDDSGNSVNTQIYQVTSSTLFNFMILSSTQASNVPLLAMRYATKSQTSANNMAIYKVGIANSGQLTQGVFWTHSNPLSLINRITASLIDTNVWFAAYTTSGPVDDASYVVLGTLSGQITVSQFLELSSSPMKDMTLEEITSSKIVVSGLQQLSTDTYFSLVLNIIDFTAQTIATQGVQTSSFVTSTVLPSIIGRYRGGTFYTVLSSEKLQYSSQKSKVYQTTLTEASNYGTPFYQQAASTSDITSISAASLSLSTISSSTGFTSALIQFNEIPSEPNTKFVANPASLPHMSQEMIASGVFQVTANLTSGNSATLSFDSYNLALPQSFVLSLVDASNTVFPISSIKLANDSSIPAERMTFKPSTQTLAFTLSAQQLSDWSGTMNLNVKTLITGLEYTVANIQLVFLIPDSVSIGNVNADFNGDTACRSTYNPYFFGDSSGVLNNIKGRYLHVDSKNNFLLVGESDSLPFHDQSTSIVGGFMALFNQTGQPFWIYRLQEGLPSSLSQPSSCYYATDTNQFAYVICSVRNLDSQQQQNSNVIVKLNKQNGKLIYMKYIPTSSYTGSQEVFYFQNLVGSTSFIMGTAYATSANTSFFLLQINDVADNLNIAWVKVYTDTGKRANIQGSYRPAQSALGQIAANSESHIITVQKASPNPTAIYQIDSTGSVNRGLTISSTLSSSVPCYTSVTGDSQGLMPCQITARTDSTTAKIYAFFVSLSGTTFSTATSKALVFEIPQPQEIYAGEIIYYTNSDASQSQAVFYGQSQSSIFQFTINYATWTNLTTYQFDYTSASTYPGWQTAQWSLMRTLTSQPFTQRKYVGFYGSQSSSQKVQTMILNSASGCITFTQLYINAPSTPDSSTLLTITDAASLPNSIVQDAPATQAGFRTVFKYRLSTQSFSSVESEKWEWGQGQMAISQASPMFAMRQCGAYDYQTSQTQPFSTLDIDETSTQSIVLKMSTNCANRPIDMYVWSPQGSISQGILQDFVSFTSQTKVLLISPSALTKGQSFNLNITYVDRYDGRIQGEQSIQIRYNKNNKVDFPASTYFECPNTLFPFSYGESCSSSTVNCSLTNAGHYFDDASKSLMVFGSASSGFSLLGDKTKGALTDAMVMRVNGYGTLIWMNQFRLSNSQNEIATAATVYDTYAIVAVISQAPQNFAEFKHSFVRFEYDTGRYNGTTYFRSVFTTSGSGYIDSISIMVPYFTSTNSLWNIIAMGTVRNSANYGSSVMINFNPVGSIASQYTSYIDGHSSLSKNLASGHCILYGDNAYCGQIFDSSNNQFLILTKALLTVSASNGISAAARFYLSSHSSSTIKTMRPPQLVAPRSSADNLVLVGMINNNMKILEVSQTTLATQNEYNALFNTATFNLVEQFTLIRRASQPSKFVLILSWRDTSSGLNTDGLNIIFLDSSYQYESAQKTDLPSHGIGIFFTSGKLTSEGGLYYSYSMTNYAFNNPLTSGLETLIGYLNLNGGTEELDLNECITYAKRDLSTLFSITKVPSPQFITIPTLVQTSYPQSEIYTPRVWQLQSGNSRQLQPKRMKAASLSSIALNSQCVTTQTEAIADPLSQVLSPLSVNLLSGSVSTKSSSSAFSSTLNCQGLQTTQSYNTSVLSNPLFAGQNSFLMKTTASMLSVDLTQQQPQPGIRQLALSECLVDFPNQCANSYLPLAVKKPVSQVDPTDLSYNCELDNEYPKVIGSVDTSTVFYDQDYDSTNQAIVMCGKKDYELSQDASFQTLQKEGYIVYFATTGAINWAYSARSITQSWDNSYFQQCKITKDTDSNVFVVSLLYVQSSSQLVLMKQRISDGVYTYAHSLPLTYSPDSGNAIFVDSFTQDIYVSTILDKVSAVANLARSHSLMRIIQNSRGYQLRWSSYVTSSVSSTNLYPISEAVMFNSMLTYVAQVHDGSGSFATIQSLSPTDGSARTALSKYFASDSGASSLSLATDTTRLYASTIKISTGSYKRMIRVYDTTMTYVGGVEFTVPTASGDATAAKIDSYLTPNYLVDAYYDSLNQMIITLMKTSDFSLVQQKSLLAPGFTFTNIRITAKSDETEFYVAFTSTKMMSGTVTSSVIHKLSSTLSSANSCFASTTFAPGSSSALVEGTVSLTNTLSFVQTISNTRLQPSADLYLESKIQFRDIMLNRPVYQNCQPYGLSFFETDGSLSVKVSSTQTYTLSKPNICSGDTSTMTHAVDKFSTQPSWITVDASNAQNIVVTVAPTDDSQVGIYNLRFTFTLNSYSATISLLISVYTDPAPINAYQKTAASCISSTPALFHLNANDAVYFIGADTTDDFTQFAICGHRASHSSLAFFQLYDSNQNMIVQKDLNAGITDSYSVDCQYFGSSYLYQIVNSYTNAENTEMGVYIFKHSVTGQLDSTKELAQSGYILSADGFQVGTNITIYGRQSGLLQSTQNEQPFVLILTSDLRIRMFKVINLYIGSQIKALTYSSDSSTIYSILGTKDTANNQNRIWAMISLNSYSLSEGWGIQLKDGTSISAPDFSDYSRPGIAYGSRSVLACVFYSYSYTSTPQHEAALIQLNTQTAAVQRSLEWSSSSAFQSCSVSAQGSTPSGDTLMFVELSTATRTNIMVLRAHQDGSAMTNEQSADSTKSYLTLNVGSSTPVLHRFKYDSTNKVAYLFSSVYYTSDIREKIGAQFMSSFKYDSQNSYYAWQSPCPQSSILSYLQESQAIADYNPGNGVAAYTQASKWVSFDIQSKMVSKVYLDNFFYMNPANIVTRSLFTSSPQFVDYKSPFGTGSNYCSAVSNPTAPTGLLDYVGASATATTNAGFVVRNRRYEISLLRFTQCQNQPLSMTVYNSDGSALSELFMYDSDLHKLYVLANNNDYVGQHNLVMKATVDSDSKAITTVSFIVEILQNSNPSIDVSNTTYSVDEGSTTPIDFTISADVELDAVSVIVGLYDSSGNLLSDIDWFNIKSLSSSQIKVKIDNPSLPRGVTSETYSIIAQAWDQFHQASPISKTIALTINAMFIKALSFQALTITNVNNPPVLATTSSLDLGSYTIGHYTTPKEIPITNYYDADNDVLTQTCTTQSTLYITLAKSGQKYTVRTPNADTNANAGQYTISCAVSDTIDTETFVYTVDALFNEPATTSPTAAAIPDKSITLFDTALTYTMQSEFVGRCTDPEGDPLTETIYYDKSSIQDSDNDLYEILSFNQGTHTLTIHGDIRTHNKVFTYQLWYSCNDKYNPLSSVDVPFRIVVSNPILSPTTSGSQPYMNMFYAAATYAFTVDTSKFASTIALTYTLVGTLNDDVIKDGTKTITVAATSPGVFTMSNFDTTTTNGQAQNGVAVEGYVKASDVHGQSAYSRFYIVKSPCHESCATCNGLLTTNCLTCDNANLLYKKADGSCGACPTNSFVSSGACTTCNAQCSACTSLGNSITTNGCVCKTKTNMVDLTCVASCPAGTSETQSKCYTNYQPIFTSVLSTSVSVSISEDSVWWFRATDSEGDTITASIAVKDASNAVVTSGSGLTVVADSATNPPFNFKLVFSHSTYTLGAIAKETTKALTATISITDGLSSQSANAFQTVLTITNVNNPPVLATTSSLDLGSYTIGHYTTPKEIPITNYYDADNDVLTQTCTTQSTLYITLAKSGQKYTVRTPNADTNANAGQYTISCAVSDTIDTETFVYTVDALFNEPATTSPTAAAIPDKSITLFDTALTYTMQSEFVGRCTDPEGDPLTETIYYDKSSIQDSDNDLYEILSFNQGTHTLTIHGDIRTHNKVFTYQLWYSCNDKYNPLSSVDVPFRIVVSNPILSPTTSGSQPYMNMFYAAATYAFTVDTSKFASTIALTYTLVGTLNDDVIKDGTKTITVAATSPGVFTMSNFDTTTTNGQAQNGVAVEGYVKASDVHGQSAYSRFYIVKSPCHESCATCNGLLTTNCLTCDNANLLYKKADGSCGACPTNSFVSSGACTTCNAQCSACTSLGNSITTNGCVCKTKTNMVDLTCVASCPAGTSETQSKCYTNYQPIFTSVLSTSVSVSISEDSVWWFRATDSEGDTITASIAVKDASNAVVTSGSGLTVVADSATNPPFNFKLVFSHSTYTLGAIAKETTKALTATISITDGLSSQSANKLTISLALYQNTVAPYLKDGVSLIIDSMFISQSFSFQVLNSLFTVPTANSVTVSCVKNTPLSAVDSNWISLTQTTTGVTISGNSASLSNSYVGIYTFTCYADDGIKRLTQPNYYTWIMQVTPGYKVTVTPLNPNTQYQIRNTIQNYNLISLCTDNGGQKVARALLVNGTSYLTTASYASFLAWDSTTALLTYTLTSNTQVGTHSFTMVCSNPQGSVVSTSFQLVGIANYEPLVSKTIPSQNVKFTDVSLSIDLSGVFTDPEAQSMSTVLYSANKASRPAFITSYVNGLLSLSLASTDAGTYNLEIRAYDNITQESLPASFTLTIQGCDETCQTCSGVLETQCISCYDNNQLYQSQCFNTCPAGTYIDDQHKCQGCPAECATCDKPDDMGEEQCFTCNDGYFLSVSLLSGPQLSGVCSTNCPIDYFGNVTTGICEPISNKSIDKASQEEYSACKDFASLFTFQTETEGVSPFDSMTGAVVTCKSMYQCADGSKNQSQCTWVRKFALQCSYSSSTGRIILRVATNTLPDHCMDTSVLFPKENLVDFQVRFNTPVTESNNLNVSSSAVALSLQCSSSWVQDHFLPDQYEYTLFSGSTTKIVGIALNGVPLFQGTSELYYDAFKPKNYGLYKNNQSVPIDACLGNAQYSSFYHYYSVSPCILATSLKANAPSKLCADIPECYGSITTYMQQFSTTPQYKTQMVMGIAKDGHKILGPYKDATTVWQPCDVDFCNGVKLNGEYFYVMTLFHPYTLNCWGPSINKNQYRAQCSYNSFICGDDFAFSAGVYLNAWAIVAFILLFLTYAY